jgi:hypothetical protein
MNNQKGSMKAPKTEPKSNAQVVTVVDFTNPQPIILLECPQCSAPQISIGVNFCNNCGTKLEWKNIKVRQPKQNNPAPLPSEEAKA